MGRLGETPAGQPHAYPRTKLGVIVKDPEKRKLPNFVYPHDVIHVSSEKQLKLELKEHSHPFPMMDGSVTPKNRHAMRHHVEWICPTLRWYCKVYGVEVPPWLKKQAWVETTSKKEHKKFFGSEPLNIVEWAENKQKGRAT